MPRRPIYMRRHFSEEEQISKVREVLEILEMSGKKGTDLSRILDEANGRDFPGLLVLAINELEQKGYVVFSSSQRDIHKRTYYLTPKYYAAKLKANFG